MPFIAMGGQNDIRYQTLSLPKPQWTQYVSLGYSGGSDNIDCEIQLYRTNGSWMLGLVNNVLTDVSTSSLPKTMKDLSCKLGSSEGQYSYQRVDYPTNEWFIRVMFHTDVTNGFNNIQFRTDRLQLECQWFKAQGVYTRKFLYTNARQGYFEYKITSWQKKGDSGNSNISLTMMY